MTDLPPDDPGSRNVVPMRPVDRLARELDEAPIVGAAPPGDGAGDDPGAGSAKPRNDAPRGSKLPPRWGDSDRPRGEIWDGCPVRPLGVQGKFVYFLDIHGQLQAETKLDNQTIARLFGNRLHLLLHRYPVIAKGAKKPTPGRFDATKAMMDMMAACADLGLFDPVGAVRGVGAWSDDDGNLIYHCGDRIYIGDQALEPTTIGGKIYPAHPAIPHPMLSVKAPGPAELIRGELDGWRWQRGEIDSQIALGAIGCLMMGGALIWRPAFWVTGGGGTGKSRLQTLIDHLLGGTKGSVKSADSTAAHIANKLRHSTLPVVLDELEPGAAGKERDIIKLLRLASSGATRGRSSADQSTSETIIQSTFLASSILIPAMDPQDRQRILVLNLDAFPPGTPAPPALRASVWQPRGLALKRLLMDRWPSWAQRLENWRVAFAEARIDGRHGDNLATVMAMSEMADSPDPWASDIVAGWAARVADAMRIDLEDVGTDADDVLVHLLSQPFESFTRGEHYTVAQWIMVAGRLAGAPAGLVTEFGDSDYDLERRADAANAKLAKCAIKVIRDKDNPRLFVGTGSAAARVSGLIKLFEGSAWSGGSWGQSLGRVKGAISGREAGSRTLAGIALRGVEIPLKSIPGLMSFPQDREPKPALSPGQFDAGDFA